MGPDPAQRSTKIDYDNQLSLDCYIKSIKSIYGYIHNDAILVNILRGHYHHHHHHQDLHHRHRHRHNHHHTVSLS